MNRRSLNFTNLEVHRVRGVSRDKGYTVPEFSPGINIIYGPNASGKSTTARVLQELIWPGRTGLERPSVRGSFLDDSHRWDINIDAGHVQILCDGTPGKAPGFGPPENRYRYHLALHELIQQETRNADFAKQIAGASQGGYDLSAAAEALGFRDSPPAKRKERETLERAAVRLKEARDRQASTEHQSRDLEELEKKSAAALNAERNLELLRKVVAYHQAATDHRKIEIELEAIPGNVALLQGNERAELTKLAEEQSRLEKDKSEEEECVNKSQGIIKETGLSEQSLDQEKLGDLRRLQSELARRETEIDHCKQKVREAIGTAEQARKRIGEQITDEQLSKIDRLEIDSLDEFFARVERLRAEQALILERQKWLEADPNHSDSDVTELHEGISALGRWLAAPGTGQQINKTQVWIIKCAVLIIMILALALAFIHHYLWTLPALLSPVLVWLNKKTKLSPDHEAGLDERSVHRSTFEKLNLPPPVSWKVDAVASHLDKLMKLAAVQALEAERARRRAELEDLKHSIAEREQELNNEKQSLRKQLGIDVKTGELWFSQLLKKIDQWQDADNRATGAKHVLSGLNSECDKILQQINTGLAFFNYDSSDSAEGTRLKIVDLDARWQRFREASTLFENASRRVLDLSRQLEKISQQQSAVFERLQISEGQEYLIDDWLKQREDYHKLKLSLSRAAALLDDRKKSLAGREDLLDIDETDIQERIDQQQLLADEREVLMASITEIKLRIDEAKKGHDLTDALSVYDAALSDLKKAREDSAAAVVGNTLTGWTRQIAVEQSRPEVFSRANEILGRFTAYTLKLDLDDHASPPAFRALRSSGETSSVDELSVGERLQLLMAVRIAFIEQDEISRLPLLLDETLGTSDDERASLIIDSVIELARDGRQVFYFTAQQDEVAKWISRLKVSPVPHKLIDLEAIRSGSEARNIPLSVPPVERVKPPAPTDKDYFNYGYLLKVPGIDPLKQSLGNVHLWHLLDDTGQLYRLLSKGLSTWGQLRLLKDQGGGSLVDSDIYSRAASAARAIRVACDAWRIGRGKAVDRQVLLESGCVSETFIDAVSELADKLKGDAGKLIEALKNREVQRWRQDSTEDLYNYFIENGYLFNESPITPEEVRIRTLASISKDINSGHLSNDLVERIIASLPA